MFKTLAFQPENGFLAGENRLFLVIYALKRSKTRIFLTKIGFLSLKMVPCLRHSGTGETISKYKLPKFKTLPFLPNKDLWLVSADTKTCPAPTYPAQKKPRLAPFWCWTRLFGAGQSGAPLGCW